MTRLVSVVGRRSRRVLISVLVCGTMAAAASTATASPAKSDFAGKADANCRALGGLIAPLGNPTALPGIARKLGVVVPAFTMALRAQAELAAPPGEEGVVHSWMQAMMRYGGELKVQEKAATAGNPTGVKNANARLTTIATQAAGLSKQLGLHVCFQS